MTAPAPPPPAEWPEEVSSCYTPIRAVGKGGFASVWMAKRKTPNCSNDDHVAIKIMKDDGYSKREVDILSELNKFEHPNIVRLLQDNRVEGCAASCVVLSLARGPTLNFILTKHGALGLIVAQSISRQLVEAVAFLHGHAVIHRDIQPSNLIISGTQLGDDLWWSDNLDVDGKVLKMAKQCHVTLVDFGFARALSPEDIKTDVGLEKVLKERNASASQEREHTPIKIEINEDDDTKIANASCINEALKDTSLKKGEQPRGRSRTRDGPLDTSETSVSHTRIRDLSALGTRNYAAPEILTGVRSFADFMSSSIRSYGKNKKRRALAEYVADYGMVADAFSVGATIRHMVTGVPPNINAEDFIASKNTPAKKLFKKLKRSFKKNNTKRPKKYRLGADLPAEVHDLIVGLTFYNAQMRSTVRSATSHPWIKQASHTPILRRRSLDHGGPIEYLKCAQ